MVDEFESRPSGNEISRRAWRSAMSAIGAMPRLFVAAGLIFTILEFTTFYTPQFGWTIFPPRDRLAWNASLQYLAIDMLWAAIRSAVSAPIAVAVHRYIL